MRRIAKMPLWAESRIHGDVYVRFGGRLLETYRRKVTRRRLPSLRHADPKRREAANRMSFEVLNDVSESKNESSETGTSDE